MITTTLALAAVFAAPAPATTGNTPMLYIERIQAMDNVDQGDVLGTNRADFYAMVWINGKEHTTHEFSADDARPEWKFPLDLTKRINTIKIRVMDEDGGLERSDDHIDISPKKGVKDVTFKYDRYTGKLTGDVRSFFGRTVKSEGKHDDDRATIYFSIVK